jgi:hypothetical protein
MTLADIRACGMARINIVPTKRTTVTLDDVYGSDQTEFPLEQEAADWDGGDLDLLWDETEVERVASDLGVRRSALS